MKAFALLFLPLLAAAGPPTTAIKVNQAGYLPGTPKIAIVSSPAKEFLVRRVSDDAEVLRHALSNPGPDPDTGDTVQHADFTKITQPGDYYLDVPGVGRSWPFSVKKDVYARALYLAARAFYGQRCGIAVDLGTEFAGYRYEACHRAAAWHASSGKSGPQQSTKGWHDAGDYGRYVVNSGLSTGTLLWAWELYQPRLTLYIPESSNTTPDLLDEIRWNLEWMLSMQDSADGGVWHKQTSERFAGFVMPDKDTLPSVVIGTGSEPYKSSCATADFAAVLAIAARVYKPLDAPFAARSLRAAEHAWTWLAAHPNVLFRNPPGILTGEYGDRDCSDETLWAAAELWRTTRAARYLAYFLEHYRKHRITDPPNWPNVAPMALWTYALAKSPADAGAVKAIREDSLRAAEDILARMESNGYRIALSTKDYVWGSNGVLANYGVQLLVANALQSDRRYVEAALENLHYLLGRNTFSVSFVTQLGANPYRNPHHRPSGADTNHEPWPGLLSGGPNQRKQDPAMKKLGSLPPARMFLDEQESYASNEIAINWQAPLVFLLAGVSR
ncbi:MAG: glycoside hydrolase family 9 protein [Bryobacteraceae bacterium]|nr:glycoside hydrolase family 9 protein [Bryobacteraceae bacterium]